MCEFCNDIKPLRWLDNGTFKGYYPEKNESGIVKDEDGNFHYWDDGGDPFAAGVSIANMKYCPICGRDLRGGK